jgi:hypothetical protein
VLLISPRGDIAAKLTEWLFVVELGAGLATGAIAAVAAFATTIPGIDRRFLLLPLLPLALLVASVGYGCVDDWMRLGDAALTLRPDWICVSAIVLIGAGPAATITYMLRRGAPLTPHITTALAGLAAAGLANVALRLILAEEESVVVLVWHIGAIMLLTALAGLAGRYVLSWRSTLGLAGQAGRGGATANP